MRWPLWQARCDAMTGFSAAGEWSGLTEWLDVIDLDRRAGTVQRPIPTQSAPFLRKARDITAPSRMTVPPEEARELETEEEQKLPALSRRCSPHFFEPPPSGMLSAPTTANPPNRFSVQNS